jgi:hypothetical protein
MSDEDFLARWSRRKREAAEERADAAPTTAPPAHEGDESAHGAEVAREAAQAPPPTLPPAGDALVFDPASLPPIESITAETDIRAFLAPGVPVETARAALRRAWSADPAIRDFVGLAEYAWDFTKPDAMPGFGPLEMTDALRRYAAQILGAEKGDGTPGDQAAAADATAAPEQVSALQVGSVSEQAAVMVSEKTRQGAADAPPSDDATTSSENVIVDGTDAAPQHEAEKLPSLARRSHGGALPE